ncbi:Transcriptional repressor NF-X1 [Chytriomyces hyalinus]|nr:Transcriptional repressor NF-X1 [Chytriomyces hyalinus]
MSLPAAAMSVCPLVLVRVNADIGVPLLPASAQVPVARFVTGRLRIATHLLPAEATHIQVHFFGSTNGVRDSDSGIAGTESNPLVDGDPVNISLSVWAKDEYNESLVPGVHEFPFSLQIPSNILPSYNFLLSSMPFSHQFDSANPTFAKRQTRFYELVASVVCSDNTLIMSNDPCPVVVKQAFPRWLRGEDKVGRGATAGGEFNVSVTIPRYVFHEDGQMDIYVTIEDGSELVKRISSVRCYLVETASLKTPSQHIPIPIPIGTLFRYKVPPMQAQLDRYPLFSPQNPLKITLQLAESRPDLNTLLLQLNHSLVFEFVYKSGTSSVGASNPVSSAAQRSRGSPASMGSSSRAHSVGTSGSTQNSVIIDPLRTIQMIHEALDKRSSVVLPSSPLASENSNNTPAKATRLKASLIVPVRIVHAVQDDDVDLIRAFGGTPAFVPAPIPVAAAPPMDTETILTVRIGYEPSSEYVDLNGGSKDVEDQLKMSPGDQVIISETFDDGWAVGTNLTTSMAGLFPVAVVKFIPTAALTNGQSSGAQPAAVPLPDARHGLPEVAVRTTEAPETDKEAEKRKLKEQMEQMQQMMLALQMKLESLYSDLTLRKRLELELAEELYECNICIDVVFVADAVFACDTCHAVSHLRCVDEWASTQSEQWRCPSCPRLHLDIPEGACYCGKALGCEEDPYEAWFDPPHR